MRKINQCLAHLQANTSIKIQGIPLESVLREVIISKIIEAAFYLDSLLKLIVDSKEGLDVADLDLIISQEIKSITQLPTFAIVYKHIKKSSRICYEWKNAYKKQRLQGLFQRFNEWIKTQNPSHTLCRRFLQILICQLPQILKYESMDVTQKQFEGILLWLSYFEVENREEHLSVCQAAQVIKEARTVSNNDFQDKGHLMLKIIIQILGQQQRKNGSLFIFFDAFSIREKHIEYFCNLYEHTLQDLDQKSLLNIFVSLTQSGINKQILFLIKAITNFLQNGQHYYTLRYLYQNYILPILAYRYKSHRKLHREVFNIVLIYVAGFLTHCKLDQIAIQCLTQHIEDIQADGQVYWAQLALLACKDDLQLRQNTVKKLSSLKHPNISQISLRKHIEKNNLIWRVNMRNGRKLKKYPQIDSNRYVGLVNHSNQCYIISTVQALFITQQLPLLLQKLKVSQKKGKMVLAYELRRLFEILKKQQPKHSISGLKKNGPEIFQSSNNQQDAQEYLIQLLDMLRYEITENSQALSAFQEILDIETSCKYICQSCQFSWQKQGRQHNYTLSFRYNEHFQFQAKSKIEGFACKKCNKADLIVQTTITNEPKLLILHINRFFHKQGVASKTLGNKPIKRRVGNYTLAGFLNHRGAKIEAGHYIFYGRIGKDRWGLFDDGRVAQFTVNEDEQFQRQFRSENTPYILFYRLNKK